MADPKPKPTLAKQCGHCGAVTKVPAGVGWEEVKRVPFCATDYALLYAKLPPNFTPQNFVEAYLKVRPENIARAEQLEVELGLLPPCPCNVCKGVA